MPPIEALVEAARRVVELLRTEHKQSDYTLAN